MTQGEHAVLVIICYYKNNITEPQKFQIAFKTIKHFKWSITGEDITQEAFTNKHNSKRHMSDKKKQTLNETQKLNGTRNGFEQSDSQILLLGETFTVNNAVTTCSSQVSTNCSTLKKRT